MRPARRSLILALAGLSVACAHYVPLEPLDAERTVENLDPDEQHLWKQSREIQHEIGLSGLLYEDVFVRSGPGVIRAPKAVTLDRFRSGCHRRLACPSD